MNRTDIIFDAFYYHFTGCPLTDDDMQMVRSQFEVNGHTYDWDQTAQIWTFAEKDESNHFPLTVGTFRFHLNNILMC